MPQDVTYTVEKHRHRFAAWAAARAAQRGWLPSDRLIAALEVSGAPNAVRQEPSQWPATPVEVDAAHRRWAAALLDQLGGSSDANTYGRAAKLLAIYLKITVVLAGHEQTAFGRALHPPIDALLLRSLAGDDRFAPKVRALWRGTRWTQLDESRYFQLIESLRAAGLAQPAFWAIESYWQV